MTTVFEREENAYTLAVQTVGLSIGPSHRGVPGRVEGAAPSTTPPPALPPTLDGSFDHPHPTDPAGRRQGGQLATRPTGAST
jgi:hypothetical protein